ncbi:MAG: nucleotide exchange factor GrpE [Cyanobacterium sp. T60_A2020_053]|nr:nucleotide exchange factor GrpE [Cyanobacterium sp. T60_A2020_053]
MTETNNYMEIDQEVKELNNNLSSENTEDLILDDTEEVTDLNQELQELEQNTSAPHPDTATIDEIKSEEEVTTAETEENSPPEDENEEIKLLQTEIAHLKEQLTIQQEQNQAIQGQYMRLTADFDNYRRRTSKEKEELETQVKKKTITELLSVVDNFERARSHIKPANDGEMVIHRSYQGVYKNFVDALKKLGVSAMRPEGQIFDPNFHEAMLRESSPEPEGTVLEQLVRGYMLNEEVLRYAMVKVAAPMENDTPPENEEKNE